MVPEPFHNATITGPSGCLGASPESTHQTSDTCQDLRHLCNPFMQNLSKSNYDIKADRPASSPPARTSERAAAWERLGTKPLVSGRLGVWEF